jgi:hypothetical protein
MGTIQQVVVESLRAQLSTLQIESIPVVGIWCLRPLAGGRWALATRSELSARQPLGEAR